MLRRFQRYLASLQIHLMGADYLKFHSGICREVREFDLAQKTDSVFRKCFRVNDSGSLQNLLQETDTADGLRLPAAKSRGRKNIRTGR